MLGTQQYKAPPAAARAGGLRGGMGAGAGGGAGAQWKGPAGAVSVDPVTGEEFGAYEGVAEGDAASYEGGSYFDSGVVPPPPEGDDAPFPDAAAEASATSDVRARGEDVLSAALNTVEEETSKKKLPSLGEILPTVPTAIQEAVDDIFRAKWTKVTRVKKRDLFQA